MPIFGLDAVPPSQKFSINFTEIHFELQKMYVFLKGK